MKDEAVKGHPDFCLLTQQDTKTDELIVLINTTLIPAVEISEITSMI